MTGDPAPERALDDVAGRAMLQVSWGSTAVFALTAIGDQVGVGALELPATVTALALFGAGIVVWMSAFLRAVSRSRTDEITLTGLFFLQGTAPRVVQVHLLGSLAVAVVVASATAIEAPFGVLEPVFPLAMAGLWAAHHGTFGPRRPRPDRKERVA